MPDITYYQKRAAHTRNLADGMLQWDVQDILYQMAQEYDELVEDLEAGVTEVRHPELLATLRS
jgi:hypothetical protein